MKTRLILAGLALTAFSATPASAADFGGNCCADLEERIAELEATTARRGNRKVSLTIYGHVNEAIGFWDDGFEKNQYVFTNDTSRSRFGFKGKAKITDDWFAAYKIEVGVRSVDQGALSADEDAGNAGLDLRHSSWTIGSKTYGSLSMGLTEFAHEAVTLSQTARIGHFANPDIVDGNDSFEVRQTGTGANHGQWDNLGQVLEPGEGVRGQLVRYDTPAFAGFTAHAHWGEDDIWGVALKYAGELGAFNVVARIGYGEMSERNEECLADEAVPGGGADCEEYGMSASVMHTPTGLFVTGAYGMRKDNGRARLLQSIGFAPSDELYFYHIQAGIEQKWISLGKSTVFGGYQMRDAGHAVRDDSGAGNFDADGNRITNFESEIWEVGFNQQIAAAEMDIYIHYKHYDAELTTTAGRALSEPWQTVIMGSRIKF